MSIKSLFLLKWTIAIGIAILFTLSACKNDDDAHEPGEDMIAPVLTLSSPTEGQNFVNGDTIHIMGNATDETALHQYVWSIKDAAGSLLHEATESIHDQTEADIHQMHVVSDVTAATTWTVTIHVEDHGENESEKSININVAQ